MQNEFRFAKKEEQIKKMNRYMSISMSIYNVLILSVCTISVIDGNRTLGYFIALATVMLTTSLIVARIRKKDPTSARLRYVALMGLFVSTFMIAIVYDSYYMRFMTTIPFYSCILYGDKKFSWRAANTISGLNLMSFIVRAFVIKNYEEGGMVEQLAATVIIIIMMYLIVYLADTYMKFQRDSLGLINAETEAQQEMVADVMNIAEEIRLGAENAIDIVNELKESSATVKQSVSGISESTTQTAENIQTQNIMTQNIQHNIEQTVARSENMVKVAEKSSELNKDNAEKMKQLKEHADVLAQTNAQVAESMKNLQDNVLEVRTITQTILDISSQTNLLALNASIESARAGEAGRGFAVVADQIRELSAKTRLETENIKAILDKLTANANQTADAVGRTVEVTNVQDEMITEIAGKVDELNTNVQDLVDDIEEIDKMLEDLSSANNQIVDNIVQLSATTEEVTASAQESSALTELNYNNSLTANELLMGIMEVSKKMEKYSNNN